MSAEFRVWLKEEEGRFFDELDADHQRKHFRSFRKRWNRGKLSKKYYDGSLAEQSKLIGRTRHEWTFRGAEKPEGADKERVEKREIAPLAGPRKRSAEEAFEEEEEREQQYKRLKLEQKKWNRDRKEDLEELVPKATGREALVEKKQAARAERRAREESPDAVPGVDVMGSDGGFKAMVARQRAKREETAAKKQADLNERLTAYQQKEKEKMDAFKKQMGLL
eukprot:TRINITY_DN3179_c1_g1_i1.p1 TRINITY_DN3179_c1_g1~~TRINITY_DN3179_c1_g1_i1.p1  ORF type:complete len:222 (+),score=48.08 TRINITY_DN3179_c1_g1_i1:218-883(+)